MLFVDVYLDVAVEGRTLLGSHGLLPLGKYALFIADSIAESRRRDASAAFHVLAVVCYI